MARASGVSRATVSYVLNEVPNRNISEPTRELVRATAKRLGHVPFAPARALSSGRSDIVLALVPGFTLGYVFEQGLEALDVALARRGAALMVHRHLERVRPLPELWKLVSPVLVVTTGGLNEPELLSIRNSDARLVDIGSLVSHHSLGRAQAEYLIGRGHRRLGFGFPTDPNLEEFAEQRLGGVRAACLAAGIPEPVVQPVAFDQDGARDAIEFWRSTEHAVTAVCAHNDDVALVILAGLSTLGLRAPEDLAVMGIDNTPMAGIGLTTIAIDTDAWSSTVVEHVIDSLDDKPLRPLDRDLYRLVVRTSA